MSAHHSLDQRWRAARAAIDTGDIVSILCDLIDTPSPTGEERPLMEVMAARLSDEGIEPNIQTVEGQSANLWAKREATHAGGSSLMLYAPVDTVTSNNAEEDLPWAAEAMLPELYARSVVENGFVRGLGAHNPKGHAACVCAAFIALHKADIPLGGALFLGLGGGGMPTNPRIQAKNSAGHGSGCAALIDTVGAPAAAVIAKSGWTVSWEEVGLAWYEVTVKGTHTYVGSRHLMPYANAIAKAAKIVEGLEQWFPDYAARHRSGLVEPQGVVSFFESGWERMPAFTPAQARFRFDLRLSPRTAVEEADEEVDAVLEHLAKEHDVDLSWSRVVFIPGTTTPPDAPIVEKSIACWSALHHREHVPVATMSGATDANILRLKGIPTARIGLPKAQIALNDFQKGMNTVAVNDLWDLTSLLIGIAISATDADAGLEL